MRPIGSAQQRILSLIRTAELDGREVSARILADYTGYARMAVDDVLLRVEHRTLIAVRSPTAPAIVLTARGRDLADQIIDLDRLLPPRRVTPREALLESLRAGVRAGTEYNRNAYQCLAPCALCTRHSRGGAYAKGMAYASYVHVCASCYYAPAASKEGRLK